jgi:hypothetical protein
LDIKIYHLSYPLGGGWTPQKTRKLIIRNYSLELFPRRVCLGNFFIIIDVKRM